MTTSRGRVVVAMSGGVDSSVAALLLHQAGYDVVGVTMRLWSVERPTSASHRHGCCSQEDWEDARRVCQTIGIRHYLINAEREFQSFVVDYFAREYQRGRTPNPCIACNDRIKFDFLLRRALLLDADFIATGHYARIAAEEDGTGRLLKAVDNGKDQSYVLFGLTQPQLARLLLPVGEYHKEDVRRLAAQGGLPVAAKPDSQEVCFIPEGGYRRFLTGRFKPHPGEIVDTAGHVLGHHDGLEFFTVGQRRGLGLATGEPLYVVALEPEAGRVVVGPESALYRESLWAAHVNWLAGAPPVGTVEASVKIRYRAGEAPAIVEPCGEAAHIRFHQPQRAVTPGQAAVFYQGDEVLGGGFIEAAEHPCPSVQDVAYVEAKV